MITGRSASRSSAAARSSARGVGARPAAWAAGSAGSGSTASMNTWSSGKSRNAGPPCGRSAAAQASSTSAGISAVEDAVAASLTSGRTNGTWSISCSDPWPQRSAGARPPSTSIGLWRLLGRAERAHAVRHARAGGERAHARLPRHLRPALGGEGRGGLVAHVDERDALGAAAVVDREQMPARQREQRRHAVRLQAPGDQAPAVQGLGLRLHRHRRGNIPPSRGVRAARGWRGRPGPRSSVRRHGRQPAHAGRLHAVRGPRPALRRGSTRELIVPDAAVADERDPDTVDAFNAQILAGLVSP